MSLRAGSLLYAAILIASFAAIAQGDLLDTQTFTCTVPNILCVEAPIASVAVTHDGSTNDQSFAVQTWTADCNLSAGATVVIAVATPFVHATLPTEQRDCELTLALNTADPCATWLITTANDITDLTAGIPILDAAVVATSTGPGGATFDLTVDFVTGDTCDLTAGVYSTIVTGTITAN